ncbi:HIBADH [Cordylochernes scorpioides]|uniref:3-hydroxyisobutyrate dehydrogenase n=1 Tax=Cordylochernes scorpioides TaxID=51811 RepID=A0ABY6KEK2_9ARAC|nr:HIBADH [Cordylochernes scorpioides]
MGKHMAANIQKKGYPLVVFDVNKMAIDELVAKGATAASSLPDLATQCTHILTMLPGGPQVQEVYTNNKTGLLNHAKNNTIIIDSSTIEPFLSRDIAKMAKDKNIEFLDAPVSGGVGGAEKGTLTFMVGGNIEKGKQLLEAMGSNVVHCGDNGSGLCVKICNNMLLAISMIGTAEAMNLAIKLGLDPKIFAKIMNMSSGRCWSSDTYNPVPGVMPTAPANRDYEQGFATALMTKDLGLAQSVSTQTGAPTPLGSLSHQIYRVMMAHGLQNKDFSIVYKFLSEN